MSNKKELNNKDIKIMKNKRIDNIKKCGIYAGLMVGCALLSAEFAQAAGAAKFDVNAGVEAATTPLINAVKAHWGKGVLLTSTGAALLGEGDGRQRATRAVIAAGASGGVILGLIALLT